MNCKVVFLLRCLLGGIFIWAGLVKVGGPMDFLVSIYGYDLGLPETPVRITVVVLPWIEILSGIAIVTGIWQQAGLILSALMLAAFLAFTGQAWLRGLDISCGCFGSLLEEESILGSVQFAFLRNLVLMAITVTLLVRGRGQR
ncbi:MAG: MauE/DoxX family redox-associated membrane protein [Opitutaceae bacterium]